jgi:hypothetical protein
MPPASRSKLVCFFTCSAYSLTLKMEAVHSSETLADFYQNIWYGMPEESTLHNQCHQNTRTHTVVICLPYLCSIYFRGLMQSIKGTGHQAGISITHNPNARLWALTLRQTCQSWTHQYLEWLQQFPAWETYLMETHCVHVSLLGFQLLCQSVIELSSL